MGCGSSSASENIDARTSEEVLATTRAQRRKLSVAPENVGPISKKGERDVLRGDEYAQGNMTEVELKARGNFRHTQYSVKGVLPFSKGKVNQDRGAVVYALGGNPRVSFFAVMDGHGEFGHDVSEFIKNELPEELANEKNIIDDPEGSIFRACQRMNAKLEDETNINCAFSGSTLVFSILIDRSMLYVANVGDSRCVLSTRKGNTSKAVGLSEDQKPDNPLEKRRIIEAGGRVEPLPGPPNEDLGPMRVWLTEVDVPGLAMSRSVGDKVAKTVGVTAVPEIQKHRIGPDDEFFIWASDGVWEFMSNQEAVDVVAKHKNNQNGATKKLVNEAIERWKSEEEVIDDTTAVILFLK